MKNYEKKPEPVPRPPVDASAMRKAVLESLKSPAKFRTCEGGDFYDPRKPDDSFSPMACS